jgi:hypothetical protein
MELAVYLVVLIGIGAAVEALAGRWWILVLAAVPTVAVGGGYADSGPRWLLALVFAGVPLVAGLALGVGVRKQRSRHS